MLYTIGHSNHPIQKFIQLLRQHGIETICDVRSHPYSRYAPQYTQKSLQRSLADEGIGYLFLGNELGARSTNPDCYRDGKIQYDLLAKQPSFAEGINRVIEENNHHRTALMCMEKNPAQCHRALLVARKIFELGVPVSHILADGSLDPHQDLESRLLKKRQAP